MHIAFRRRSIGVYSALIKWWTNSPYDHCEILFPNGTLISAIDMQGVRAMTVSSLSPDVWDIVEVMATPSQEAKAYQWALGELGCKYDWMGILLCQVLRLGRHHSDRWFCSEFCAAGLQQAGFLPGVKPYKLSPGGLYRLLTAKVPSV
jgi:uncharacterized protein YycO